MSTLTIDDDSATPTPDIDEGQLDVGKIRGPRPAVLEFLLTFSTFSFSSCFWFVGRIRDLQAISKEKFTPWLWFFVPLFALAQLFALPRFFDQIHKVNIQQNNPKFKFAGLIMLVMLVVTCYSTILTRFELPFWIYYVSLVAWSGAIAVVQVQFNRISLNAEGVEVSRVKYFYRPWDWALLVLGLPINILVMYWLVLGPLLIESTDLVDGQRMHLEGQPFEFTIVGDEWKKVPIGTYSDGTAEMELGGPYVDMQMMVFKYGVDDTLNSTSYWREQEALEEINNGKCQQDRYFEPDSLKVSAMVVCEGEIFNDPKIFISKYIQTETGIYELYGSFSSVKATYSMNKDDFILMVKGFKQK